MQVHITQKHRAVTEQVKKNMLDREVPFNEIPPEHQKDYIEAEKKEWSTWRRTGCVRILSEKESEHVRRTVPTSRVMRLRFVYKDKNAALRTPQAPLPVKAKARLCAQGSREPLAMSGQVKLDSPTVQRVGVMVFLQLLVNFGWIKTWWKADITAAFLQGKDRDVEQRGRLYLHPPNRPLEGVGPRCLLEVIKSVYGLPDAPRAWFEELTEYLIKDLGFVQTRVDSAFLVWYGTDRSVKAMMILHVDDMMIATDESAEAKKMIARLETKYPYGEWVRVCDQPRGVQYTGRNIRIQEDEVVIDQEDFISGRMDSLKNSSSRHRSLDNPCSPVEVADFRTAVGNLH
jgi:hypothetical protein